MMTMMNYNYPYYPRLVEDAGLPQRSRFHLVLSERRRLQPARPGAQHCRSGAAARHACRSNASQDKNELKAWADRIGQAYNDAFVNNWEYYPLTEREIKFILDNILVIADPKLIKIITHDDQVVGFLLGFHDVSAGLQRARGRSVSVRAAEHSAGQCAAPSGWR